MHPHQPTAEALTFVAATATFLSTVGHALQGLFFALAAVGSCCAGVASLARLVWDVRREKAR